VTPAARIAAAIELLAAIEASGLKPADAVANDYFRARRFIGAGDRRVIAERVWRVLRSRRRLGWWLSGAGVEPAPRLLVAVSMVLDGTRVTAVQALFSGGRFAPALFARDEVAALARLDGHTLEHPAMPDAVRFEVPDWLLPRLKARFGAALAGELNALSAEAPLDLRVNLLAGTRDEARASLAADGIEAEPTPLSPWGLRVAGRRPVSSSRAFRSGLVEIQDEGSQVVAALVGARPGMRVADFCAGAGGKTLALAMMMRNQGRISACDVAATRLEAAVRRLRRAGVHNVERHLLGPGEKWAKRRAGMYDRVLVDAPCTGVGTWRRNPDARWRLSESDLQELLAKQVNIIEQAARLVRKGGRLVYATCSLMEEENESQVTAFLSRQAEFAVLDCASAWELPGAPPCAGPYLALTPGCHRTDGFFAAVLERRR
jgi:16S rRNA (cytosine967-C5)-methyltransferase